jgi:choline dehydrogenase-like flavoprotein
MPHDFWGHLRNVIADIDEVAIHAYRKLLDKDYSRGVFKLYNRTEQAPNPESRVTIYDERDRLGVNRVRLNWNLQPIDKRSIRRAQEVIGQELGRAGLGRLQAELDDDDTTWPPGLTGGNHHMGTTRMSTDPKQGVVDENCRVHGISNLFIAGSSVFSTSGHANPTLTIVALAVRLADHIKKIMS